MNTITARPGTLEMAAAARDLADRAHQLATELAAAPPLPDVDPIVRLDVTHALHRLSSLLGMLVPDTAAIDLRA